MIIRVNMYVSYGIIASIGYNDFDINWYESAIHTLVTITCSWLSLAILIKTLQVEMTNIYVLLV